ncbi:hypothetical protein BUALT_Bualt12G0145200 [Buddleja alternifolia]|uniref:Uncharacterized protein n=1 Tax=Buddleja alternifolia TaxID=168488 RepID=A0AAV6WZD6_9LAMI|nr:hypothetical protein BUALT_Bualt12G0145200 [Buddleja alternifolia]
MVRPRNQPIPEEFRDRVWTPGQEATLIMRLQEASRSHDLNNIEELRINCSRIATFLSNVYGVPFTRECVMHMTLRLQARYFGFIEFCALPWVDYDYVLNDVTIDGRYWEHVTQETPRQRRYRTRGEPMYEELYDIFTRNGVAQGEQLVGLLPRLPINIPDDDDHHHEGEMPNLIPPPHPVPVPPPRHPRNLPPRHEIIDIPSSSCELSDVASTTRPAQPRDTWEAALMEEAARRAPEGTYSSIALVKYVGGQMHDFVIDLDRLNLNGLFDMYTKCGGGKALVNFYFQIPGYPLDMGLRIIRNDLVDITMVDLVTAHAGMDPGIPIPIWVEEIVDPIASYDADWNPLNGMELPDERYKFLLTDIDFNDSYESEATQGFGGVAETDETVLESNNEIVPESNNETVTESNRETVNEDNNDEHIGLEEVEEQADIGIAENIELGKERDIIQQYGDYFTEEWDDLLEEEKVTVSVDEISQTTRESKKGKGIMTEEQQRKAKVIKENIERIRRTIEKGKAKVTDENKNKRFDDMEDSR